ncbi:MAG: general secretion pathway protein GspB [Steroidobacteraceae bacterium]
MSFILDALKKAESERSRHSGPVLMDVRVRARRQRLPVWAWVLGCVLLANLLMLVWLLLKPDATPPAVVAPTPAAAPSAGAPSPVAAPLQAAPPPILPPPALPLSLPAAPPPAAQPVAEPASVTAAPPTLPAGLPAPTTAPITRPVAAAPAPTGADNLPTMQDLVNNGVALPTLRMSLHVYDELPGNRYVLLNSRRLREGDELPDGVKVERITPRGVVLDVGGRRFLLVAGG